jgi:hypothetical protein
MDDGVDPREDHFRRSLAGRRRRLAQGKERQEEREAEEREGYGRGPAGTARKR